MNENLTGKRFENIDKEEQRIKILKDFSTEFKKALEGHATKIGKTIDNSQLEDFDKFIELESEKPDGAIGKSDLPNFKFYSFSDELKKYYYKKTGESYPESPLSGFLDSRRMKAIEIETKKEFVEEYKNKIENNKKEAFDKFSRQFISGDVIESDSDVSSWLNDYKEYYESNNERIKQELIRDDRIKINKTTTTHFKDSDNIVVEHDPALGDKYSE